MRGKLKNPAIAIALAFAVGVPGVRSVVYVEPLGRVVPIEVNSTADDEDGVDGECTLREAIIAANSDMASGATPGECSAGNGNDVIEFDISGVSRDGGSSFINGGKHGYTITLSQGLHEVSESLTINGFSQPGSSANTTASPRPFDAVLLIELDGDYGSYSGLTFNPGSDNSAVKGLVINNFRNSGVVFSGSNNVSLQGSYIGTDPSGQVARSNGIDQANSSVAINIGNSYSGHDANTSNIQVGGLNPADRNIVSGNYGGAFGVSARDTTIQGNYMGPAADGVTKLGNGFGAGVETGNLTIDYADGLLLGGDETGAANVISGSSTGGVQPFHSINVNVVGNLIGTDHTGSRDMGNAWDGVSFAYGTISNLVSNNIIAFNGKNGVVLNNDTTAAILGNRIHNNRESAINLDYKDFLPNDPLDLDSGSNNLLNHALYTNVIEMSGDTHISYYLDVPAGDYRIEFFSAISTDPMDGDTDLVLVGHDDITHRGQGEQAFTHSLKDTTGIRKLAITATERNVFSPSSFGVSSGFGGATIR